MIPLRYLFICMLFLLIPQPGSAATIHGTVYEWSTFEPLDNALLEVNSTPVQFRVATSGVYSFNLPPGNYMIKTSYYNNDTLEYYAEDNITVTDPAGDFVMDILLFPLEEKEDDLPDVDIENVTFDLGGTKTGFDWRYGVVILIIGAGIVSYYYYRTRKEEEDIERQEVEEEVEEPHQVEPAAPLPDDLQEIISILEGAGGRITQKDLRKRLRYSEAKVSLMIADLEARGLVQKIKKGRGNILILTR